MIYNATQRIFSSKIAPDPNMNVLWMDLAEDEYGSIIKYWNGTEYIQITGAVDSASGHIIYSDSLEFPKRKNLVFSGASVTDDINSDSTIVYGLKGERGFTGAKGNDGAQGPKGDTGDTGVSGVTYRGDYDSLVEYVERDVVRSLVDGNAYYCFSGPITNLEPSTNPDNWNLFVMKGAPGQQGADGAGVASGGTTGQYLYKTSNDDFDTEWSDVKLVDEITVKGTSQGAYSDGNVIAAGTTIETIIKNMLTTIINPTYTQPSTSITNVSSSSYELGQQVPISITQTFTVEDSGGKVSEAIYKDGVSVSITNTFSETLTCDDSTAYYGTVTYSEGPIKNNNIGDPYPTGHILSGTVTSSTRTINAYRKMFYGISLPATTSAEVRSLGNSLLNPVNNSVVSFPIPIGATSVTFAYPKSLGTVLTIKDALNIDIKGAFSLTEVSVAGANNYIPILYYVYKYTPASPFAQTNTYTITI